VLAGRLGDIFGRRFIWVVTAVATGVALPLVMIFATADSVAYLMPIFGFLYGAPFAILCTYISESFPTKVRGTAVSTANSFGKIGSMLSPILIGFIAEKYSISIGIAVLGVAYVFAGLIPGLFIREKMYDPRNS
jgi:AAHS family cis,cis-muconate transporter-like MFS transporter